MPPRNPESSRQAFIKQAIAALERKTSSSEEPEAVARLADRAFNKLQFDFPVVSVPELRALAQVFRDSVCIKGGRSAYKLTAKVAANAVAGALQATPQAPASASAAPAAEGFTSSAASTASSSGGAEQPAEPELQPHIDAAELQVAYQQLCCAIYVSFVTHALALPEGDACALLDHYQLSSEDQGPPAGSSTEAPGAGEPDLAAAALSTPGPSEESVPLHSSTGPEPGLSSGPGQGSSGVVIDEPCEAAEMDGDDCLYEDFDVPSTTSNGHGGLGHTQQPYSLGPALASPQLFDQDDGAASCSQEALCHKLLHLGGQVSYAALSHRSVWAAEQGTIKSLLELLRVLGIHDSTAALQPLMLSYVALLADRMCDAPSDIVYLQQLLDALGVDGLTAAASRPAKSSGGSLPIEATAVLSLFARLALHFSSPKAATGGAEAGGGVQAASWASARQELWRHLHQHLLPLCSHCLESLSGSAPAELDMASVALVCQVLLFYVRHPPMGTDAPKALLQAGIIRSVAAVLPHTAGRGSAGEPVRLLALLCAAGSADVCKWLLAVPGLKTWMASADVQMGGQFEAYGALWQLLSAQGQAGASTGGSQGLVSLLQRTDTEDVPQLAVCLALMTDMQQVSKGGFAWGPQVQAALWALASELRTKSAAAAPQQPSGSGMEAGTSEVQAESGAQAAKEGQVEQHGEDSGDEDDDAKLHMDASTLAARRARRMVPDCIRMVKGLLTTGGKTD